MTVSKPVNYQMLEYIKSVVHPDVKIMDIYVENKWLCAILSSSIIFKVKNY